MEEFSHDKSESPHTYWVQVTNHFYIYDELGLVFYTRNGKYSSQDPLIMMICYEYKREFNHDNFPDKIPKEYMPKKIFTGKLFINSIVLEPQKTQLSKDINYNTEKIELFNTTFGATSRATIIDGLYSEKGFPYFRIYYNNGKEHYVSYVQVML